MQTKHKQQVIDLEDVQEYPPASLHIWEQVDKKKMSIVRGLLFVGIALLVGLCVSKIIWKVKEEESVSELLQFGTETSEFHNNNKGKVIAF